MGYLVSTIPTDVAALKTYYSKDQVLNSTILKTNKLFGLAPKNPDFAGDFMPVPINSSGSGGLSANFTTAYNAQTPGVFNRFMIPTLPVYQLVSVGNQAILASRNTQGGFKQLLKAETDAGMQQITNIIAAYMFRDGTGTLAQCASSAPASTGVAAGILQLTVASDAQYFFPGLQVTASANVGDTPRSGTAIVTNVDTSTGRIALSATFRGSVANLSTGAYNWVDGDYLQIAGTFNAVPYGLQKWFPSSSATYPGLGKAAAINMLYGVDRSQDTAAYAGTFYDGSGDSVRDALINGLSQITWNGGAPSILMTNPVTMASLVKETESKTQYEAVEVVGPTGISYKALMFEANGESYPIVADRNCTAKVVYALDVDDMELFSMEQAPTLLRTVGGEEAFRIIDQDAVQVRLGAYWNMKFNAPRRSGAIATSD